MRCPIDKTSAVMQIFLTFLLCSCMLIHSGFVNKKNTTQSLTVKLSPKIIYCCDNSKLYVSGDLWRWLGQRLVASGAQAKVALKPAREGRCPCPPWLTTPSSAGAQGRPYRISSTVGAALRGRPFPISPTQYPPNIFSKPP